MVTESPSGLGPLVRDALARRAECGLPSRETDAYRLIHGASDGLAGLTVDVYGEFVVVSVLSEQPQAALADLPEALMSLGFAGVYLKLRPRQANLLSDEERRTRTPERAVRGADAPAELVVRESGMPFTVRLGDGLSTGLFLDQRDNRRRVAELARSQRVLNLFAYTCAFGCAAAVGGAVSTTNVDVSKAALERGRHNYQRAGLDAQGHLFLARDVREVLPKQARRGERYGVVVLDPPSYASTKRGRFSVERDLAALVTQCLPLVADGGRLLACTNQHSLSLNAFERLLRAGALGAARAVEIECLAPPVDFPVAPGGDPHLKSAWVVPR